MFPSQSCGRRCHSSVPPPLLSLNMLPLSPKNKLIFNEFVTVQMTGRTLACFSGWNQLQVSLLSKTENELFRERPFSACPSAVHSDQLSLTLFSQSRKHWALVSWRRGGHCASVLGRPSPGCFFGSIGF